MSTKFVAERTASQGAWDIAYEARGRGEPAIVFVHGWASNRTVWHDQMDWLNEEHRVVSVDLLGHGDSDAPETDYSMSLLAGSILAVMDEERIDRAIIVGHSNGVSTARQFYREYPDRVSGLVFVDGALSDVFPPGAVEQMFAPLQKANYQEYLAQLFSMMPSPGLTETQREQIRGMMLGTPQYVLYGAGMAATDPTNWEQDQIDVPVLMVMAQSPFWPPNYEQFVEGFVPDLEYQTWPGVGHFLFLERPEAFNVLLERFADRVGTE